MDSFQDTRRQLRIALIAISIIVPTGVIGYMIIEKLSLLNAIWMTVVTLATIGYGDIVPQTSLGRVFTLILVVGGLGTFAFAAQAAFAFFVSPGMRAIRQANQADRKIKTLRNHYIICGEGEMIDKIIGFLLQRMELYKEQQQERFNSAIDRILGSSDTVLLRVMRRLMRNFALFFVHRVKVDTSLMDIVVITQNPIYADALHSRGLIALQDDPTDDRVLRRAGLMHAQSMVVMLETDTETLMTVLTAKSRNPNIYITAATQDQGMEQKMLRVGANSVIAPYEVASQFLNNATLRPAVNDFFNNVLFDYRASTQIIQLQLNEDSPWIEQRLRDLKLKARHEAGVIAVRQEDGSYHYAPNEDYVLQPNEVLLVVTLGTKIPILQLECHPDNPSAPASVNWQRLQFTRLPPPPGKIYSPEEAEEAVREMSEHYIICGHGAIIRNAINKLDPARPFVIVSSDDTMTADLFRRGFRVIHGDPTHDQTLRKAGADRALAIMISIEDNADNVLTILNSRTLSKRLLITSTANTDDIIPKLRRAGADRVVSTLRIAAQFVMLAATRPIVNDFMHYVLYNYHTGLETTELYMQDNSPWIGKTVADLALWPIFRAGIIGIRMANGRFIYAPPETYIIKDHEVLIVITPMSNSDDLRHAAHGGTTKRPRTLRAQDIRATTTIKGI